MEKNKNLNILIEKNVDNHIDNILLQEAKFLSKLSPKILKNFANTVIDNSFEVVMKAIKTVLAGGAVGGIIGFFVNIARSIAKTVEVSKEVPKELTRFDKFLDYVGLKAAEIPTILETKGDKLKFFIDNLKERLQDTGTDTIAAGILLGLSLALVHAIFIKKYKLSKKEAKEKTMEMAYQASKRADSKTKKLIDITLKEYDKIEKV